MATPFFLDKVARLDLLSIDLAALYDFEFPQNNVEVVVLLRA
jgi:hypothetical protein